MEVLQDMGAFYQEAFGAEDCSSSAMKRAVDKWFALYYGTESSAGLDHCLRLPYTVVRKLLRGVFAEYAAKGGDSRTQAVLDALPYGEAMELALIGGECYLKPVYQGRWQWRTVPRGSILVFARDHHGEPIDVGLTEKSALGRQHFTLLERRSLDEKGLLTVTNRLFRSGSAQSLGREVPLKLHPAYAGLPQRYVYPVALGSVGLVRVKTPMLNCVDGSREGVSVYAAAVELMEAIAENEAQLKGEFRKGQSRLVVSRDLLDRGQLNDDLFVALDESPDAVGITIFSPELRQRAYLERQQAYLRAVENVIGLKRGLLSEVEAVDRTATEITSSEGEYMTTLMELRRMWEQAASRAVGLCAALEQIRAGEVSFQWGDGVL